MWKRLVKFLKVIFKVSEKFKPDICELLSVLFKKTNRLIFVIELSGSCYDLYHTCKFLILMISQ